MSYNVVITGGSGLVGKALQTFLLKQNYTVTIVGRTATNSHQSNLHFSIWNVENMFYEDHVFANADIVINLAGANIAEKRWTKKRQQELIDSRVKSCNLIVKALKETNNNKAIVISASAIGWYGADNEHTKTAGFKETNHYYNDFLGNTCNLWENAISQLNSNGNSLYILRFGIIFSNNGGAFEQLIKPVKMGIVPIMGNGKQIMSWVHVDDVVGIIHHIILQQPTTGIYNATANEPASNKLLMNCIKTYFAPSIRFSIYVPSILLKILLGKMSIELLKSCTVNNEKIRATGYVFLYPNCNDAIKQLKENKI